MTNKTEQPVLLFSYGTLQDSAILKSGTRAWVYMRA
jgi:hypothetical protein